MTQNKRESVLSSAVIGATTGGLEAFIINPLVTIKTRLQNKQPVHWHWILEGKKWDFTKFLFRGVQAHVFGMANIISLRMLVRDQYIRRIYRTNAPTLKQETTAAFTGGMCSAFLTGPMELGMTLQQTAANKETKNFFQLFHDITEKYGARKTLTGTACVAGRDGVVTAGFLTFTPQMSRYISLQYEMNEGSSAIISGAAVGTTCAVSTHWLDTIKSVQQKNLRDVPDKNASTISYVVKDIFTKDGVMGFNRGLFWRTMRVAPHVGIVAYFSEKLTGIWNGYTVHNSHQRSRPAAGSLVKPYSFMTSKNPDTNKAEKSIEPFGMP